MHDRLSFYVEGHTFLHSLNPLTKLTLCLALILVPYFSPWYWTPQFLFVAVIIPLSILGKVFRQFFWPFLRIMLPAAGFLFVMQALFLPVHGTELFHWAFLHASPESLSLAFRNAMRIIVMVASFTLFLLTTHPSDLMSDLTRRGLTSQLAYVVISTLQIIPQMQAKAQTIIAAQRSRGLDTESSFRRRVGALVPLVGPLVFGSLVEVEERAIAIEARGFTSASRKTSLRDIPDTTTDKALRWALLLFVLAALALRLWRS